MCKKEFDINTKKKKNAKKGVLLGGRNNYQFKVTGISRALTKENMVWRMDSRPNQVKMS